jgi:hypothetical protein
MTRSLCAAATLLLCSSAWGAEGAVERSRAAEERGFVDVENERWCAAFAAFMEANHFAPSVDLIFNAARAADLAGDRKHAVKLYAELLGAYPDSERQAEVNNRLAALTQEVQKLGPGTSCAEFAPADEPEGGGVQTQDATALADDADPASSTSTSDASEKEPDVGNASSSETADDGADSSLKTSPDASSTLALVGMVVPWSMAGGGLLLSIAGVAASSAGIVPVLGHAQARQQILELEATMGDASDLQVQQQGFRNAWETWGEISVWSGLAVLALGLAVMAVGATWGTLSLVWGGQDEAEGSLLEGDAE